VAPLCNGGIVHLCRGLCRVSIGCVRVSPLPTGVFQGPLSGYVCRSLSAAKVCGTSYLSLLLCLLVGVLSLALRSGYVWAGDARTEGGTTMGNIYVQHETLVSVRACFALDSSVYPLYNIRDKESAR